MDHPITGFEHLHRHSDFSLLDGFATVAEYAERMPQINQKFLCITDHGVMGAVPQQIAEAEKHNLYPLIGCELYVNFMQPESKARAETAELRKSFGDGSTPARTPLSDKEPSPMQKRFDKSCHLLAVAHNNIGYSNLVRMTSWAWIHGFYRRPRVNHQTLLKYKEGITFTSGCANSEIAYALNNEGEDAAFQMLEKYMAMFSPHFYLEIMMLDFKGQKPYDQFLLKAHAKYGVPLVLTGDCLVEDTLVMTKNGFKEIRDIAQDDYVLTHMGRMRRVEKSWGRKLKPNEKVYEIKSRVGTYSFKATGKHKIRVANKDHEGFWSFEWKKVDELTNDNFLLVSKIDQDVIFGKGVDKIDLMSFFLEKEFQVGGDYFYEHNQNMGCKLQYLPDVEEFVSYRGFDRQYETRIPRFIVVDDEFLDVLGWFVAEGWSEKESNQVGFAFHANERNTAEFIVRYFEKYGIQAKIYQVSENGIAVRFSSVVFNRLFGLMCGYGANNKRLPKYRARRNFDPQRLANSFGVWSKSQMMRIISKFWLGDGTGTEHRTTFYSTSRPLIFEICAVLNSMGMFSYPAVRQRNNWAGEWSLTVAQSKTCMLHEWFGGSIDKFDDVRPRGTKYFDLGSEYAVGIKSVNEVEYDGSVWDLQVHEDESFTANMWHVHNCHYCRQEQSHNQRLMLMQQNKRTIQEIQALIDSGEAEDLFELQDQNLWLKSEEEFNQKWESDYKDVIDYDLYKQSKENSVKICEHAKGVELDRSLKLPKIPNADAVLWEEIKKGFIARQCPRTPEYSKRIKEEYELIVEKEFSSYFLIQKQMTDEARRKGPEILGFGDGSECVGPGRGSVCGSLVAYCLRLHDVEPIIHDLRFSRFLSPARGGRQARLRYGGDPVPIPVPHEEVKL